MPEGQHAPRAFLGEKRQKLLVLRTIDPCPFYKLRSWGAHVTHASQLDFAYSTPRKDGKVNVEFGINRTCYIAQERNQPKSDYSTPDTTVQRCRACSNSPERCNGTSCAPTAMANNILVPLFSPERTHIATSTSAGSDELFVSASVASCK